MATAPKMSSEPTQLQVFRHPNFKTIPERLDFVRGINASITAHSSYQGDSSVAALVEELKTCENDLSTIHFAVQAGNRTLIPQRQVSVQRLDLALYDFVHCAEKKGRTDPNALFNIGLDSLVIAPGKKSSVAAPGGAPSAFQVTNGAHVGQMLASVGTMSGVRSWELWMTDSDPSDEGSWRFYRSFFKSSDMLITGLQSGRIYYFRIRGLNSAGASPWSVVVTLRAL